ncbi:winged helix DNA-binding domain-containing protein [Streptomyces sp. NPDC057011]|uniref:winged helix DNA-binding domain-containing protein n=1 Tax=unclassified Streptomyces TaxID=2593676 RepID=UPI0036438E00
MTPSRRRVTPDERRARLGRRHLLAGSTRVRTPEEVAAALIGLHATDPATVFLSAAARMSDPGVPAVERALYEERTLARIRCLRRTMFVLPAALAPVVQAAVGRDAYMDRARAMARLRDAAGWDELRCSAAEQDVLALLAERVEVTAAEFADAVPDLREQITTSPGKPYESRQRVASTVLGVLAAEGRIRRARPAGGWTSAQFRWAGAEPLPELPASEARAALARLYLSAFGPVTESDLKWWTGWTLTATRKAIATVGAEAVGLDEGTGYLLAEDVEPVCDPDPWVALLPGLDPTSMGWRGRDWYLDPSYTPELFDRNGNIGPTVWADGRVIGAWAQRPDGSINHRLLTDPGHEARTALDREIARMTDFLGDTRVTPCYRTPLERRLSAQPVG